jgi:hypothetical protein
MTIGFFLAASNRSFTVDSEGARHRIAARATSSPILPGVETPKGILEPSELSALLDC